MTLDIAIRTYFQKIGDRADMAGTAGVGSSINHVAAVFIPVGLGLIWVGHPDWVFLIGAGFALTSLLLGRLGSGAAGARPRDRADAPGDAAGRVMAHAALSPFVPAQAGTQGHALGVCDLGPHLRAGRQPECGVALAPVKRSYAGPASKASGEDGERSEPGWGLSAASTS